MLPSDVVPVSPKKRRVSTRFPGIVRASEMFRVNRVTLYRTLMGQIPDNQKLRKRYADFMKKEVAK